MDGEQRFEAAYPCRWEYRIIGPSSELIRAAISEALAGLEYSLSFSKFSTAGKYISFSLEVTVRDTEHRDAIYKELQRDPRIRFVI